MKDILLYHVVGSTVPAETVVTLDSALTLQGSDVSISVDDDGVTLNDSVKVILTDIIASNGIIHVIDAVINGAGLVGVWLGRAVYGVELVENAADLVAVVGTDATIHFVAPSVEPLLGYRPGELMTRRLTELLADDAESGARLLERLAGVEAVSLRCDEELVSYYARHGFVRGRAVAMDLKKTGSDPP